MIEFAWAFATGLAGSLHCLGMCGPLIVAYSLHLRGETTYPPRDGGPSFQRSLFGYHAAFHGGRIAAYALSGAVAAAFLSLIGSAGPFVAARSVISLVAGTAMVILGLVLLRVFPFSRRTWLASPPAGATYLSRTLAGLLRSTTLSSRWMLGFGMGFLPCMLSWAMIVRAAATANPLSGFSVMASFGLGTTPLLLFTGFFASLLTVKMRVVGERLAASSVIIMGLILLWKGLSRLV